MERVLKHVVFGLATGGGAALLLIVFGTVLLFSAVLGFWPDDAVLLVGAASGWCYQMAPIIGLVGFACGGVGSLCMERRREALTNLTGPNPESRS